MEENRISRLGEHLSLSTTLRSSSSSIGVAINGKKKSKYVVFWALEKFIPEGFTDFKLLHVRPSISTVPTAMGAAVPISEVRDDVVSVYRQTTDRRINELLRPYKKMCERRKVKVEVVVMESDDVVAAIAEEVTRSAIDKLVIGLSLRGFLSIKIDMSSMIAAAAPTFCTVYVVSKGKLASVRPSDSGTIRKYGTERSGSTRDHPAIDSEVQDFVSEAQSPAQKLRVLPETSDAVVQMDMSFTVTDPSRAMSVDNDENNTDAMSWVSRWRDVNKRREILSSSSSNNEELALAPANCGVMVTDNFSWASYQAYSFVTDGLLSVNSATEVNLNFEIEKLKAELKHVQKMYAMAQTETSDASLKLNQNEYEEPERPEELKIMEEKAKEGSTGEKQKYEEVRREAEKVRELALKEALQRREAEIKAKEKEKEKEKKLVVMDTPNTPALHFQHFSWEEIEAATSNFSEDLKLGMGAYGTVYKCNLHHTTAAVKVLHSQQTHLTKQFDKELEILSKIRHRHLVLLFGACPERGCLVYEYMENGSLEDRLTLANGTAPIPWFDRFRIAWEVASALLFLHKSRPKPIIHRDLKPGNILLDHNFVSKLGDVGLSTMVNQEDPTSKLSVYKKTSPVGTLCYIDPEYQRTGIISAKSDVYSLGVVILQLVTAKPAIAVTHVVEEAIGDDRKFMEVLDAKAGAWPMNETRELAALALYCTELRRRDRPDLKDQILPVLERLRKAAEHMKRSLPNTPAGPPTHFVCPLLKDIMEEPCVAADGYTYDRKCIEEWFRNHNTSPLTNLPLPNKNLLPNYTLSTAISQWKSSTKH